MNRTNVIYPFSFDYLPYIKYSKQLLSDKVLGLVPAGFLGNWQVNSCDDSNLSHLLEFDKAMSFKSFSSLYIINSAMSLDFETQVMPVITSFAAHGKNIFISRLLTDEEVEKCKSVCNKNCVNLTLLHSNNLLPAHLNYKAKINAPVVAVSGMSECVEKLDSLLYLHSSIKAQGYNIHTVLTEQNELGIKSCHSFPSFMFDCVPSNEKIIGFNQYIKSIDDKYEPDIILIGIPGETMPFNDIHFGHFGIMPFYVTNAVDIDYAVLKVIHGDNFDIDYWKQMQNICLYKYNMPLYSIAVSNSALNYTTMSNPVMEFYKTEQAPTSLPENFYFNHNDSAGNSLADAVIKKLQSFGEQEFI